MSIDLQDNTRINMIKFIMEIYPHGQFVSEITAIIVEKKKKKTGTTIDKILLNQLINSKLIYERDFFQTINIVARKNEKEGTIEDYVIITDLGKSVIWEYATHLYQTNPFEYIKWLIDWVEREDPIAIEKYNELITEEIKEYIDLLSVLPTPIPFDVIFQDVSVMRGLEFESDQEINNFVTQITNFLERAIMMGLVFKESAIQRIPQQNGQFVEENIEFYRLTKNGISIVNYVQNSEVGEYNFISRKKRNQSSDFSWKHIGITVISLLICFFILIGSLKDGVPNGNIILFGPLISLFLYYIWNPLKEKIEKMKEKMG